MPRGETVYGDAQGFVEAAGDVKQKFWAADVMSAWEELGSQMN